MFLSARSTQAEYLDSQALGAEEVKKSFRELERINRLFLHTDPFQRLIVPWLGAERSQALTILDLGAGDGSLGRALELWSARQGFTWKVTSLDLNPHALRLNARRRNVRASVLALPFPDDCFDLVMASQMTHHLSDGDVAQHFREAWRVTRDALFVNDLHRNGALLAMVWVAGYLTRLSPSMRSDGLLSVRRGWRLAEWRELARKAGIPKADVSLYFGSRIFLRARK